jgi:N-acetyltransferase 10
MIISKYDYNRLEKYSRNQIKYQLILDLVPEIAKSYFLKRFNFSLSYTQAAILLGFGLQYKSLEVIQEELNIPLNQVLAMFNKCVKKVTNYIKGIYETEIEKENKLTEKVIIMSKLR